MENGAKCMKKIEVIDFETALSKIKVIEGY
jgi:hypothetical protein